MSALAVAPLPSASADSGSFGMDRERRRLRLVFSTPRTLPGSDQRTHLLETWDRALEATGRALDAAERTKVYSSSELAQRRWRLSAERRWLLRLRDLGPYDALPRLL